MPQSSIVVVTGASKGIGYEICLELSRRNITSVAIARSGDELKKLHSKASDSGAEIIPVTADLTVQEDLQKIKNTVEDIGRVRGLINNAGALVNKSFMETEMSDWTKLLDVNLLAPVQLIKLLMPHFQESSHIVNISSMSGFQGSVKFPGLSAYSASKAALAALTEVLSLEFSENSISVNCLCLGAVQTQMLEEAFPGFEAPVSAKDMGVHIADFVLEGHTFYNGKVLPVALNNPE